MAVKSLALLIWICVLVIPLTFNFWGLDPALYSKFLLLDFAMAGTTLVLYSKSNGEFKISKITYYFLILYGGYIALSIISMLGYSINTADGWFVWLHLFTLPAFVLLLLLIDQQITIRQEEVAFIISCLAGVSIVVGLIQYGLEINAHGWHLSAADAMKSTYAHKNIFSEVMLLTFPFSLYEGFLSIQKRILTKVINILTFIFILLLLSRAVWLGMIVACLVTLLIYYIALGKSRFVLRTAIGMIVGIGFCFVFYHWFVTYTDAGDYMRYFYQHRDTVTERKQLWNASWQIIRLHPWVGSGLGSWKILNMRYAIVGLRGYQTFFQQPHNDYLWVICEQGVLAFLVVSMAWIVILYSLIRKIFSSPSDPFLYCLLFGLCGYGVYAGLAFPKERAEHGIILAFIVFFILRADNIKLLDFSKYFLLPIAIVTIACGWWSCSKIVGEIHLRKYFEARSINDTSEEREQLGCITPTYCSVDGTATPIAWYMGMLEFSQGNTDNALGDFEEAVKANPYHAYSLSNVGTCLNIKGDKAGAERNFKSALEYSPGFPDAALNLCALKFNEGKIDSAALYLGMVNDSLSNTRYVKSLNVVTETVITSINESMQGDDMEILRRKVLTLSKNNIWQYNIFKKAYIHNKKIKKQVLEDVLWSMEHDNKDTTNAARYRITLNQF